MPTPPGHSYDPPQPARASTGERLAIGLGCFSIGLGLTELLAPGKLANFIGVNPENGSRNTLRAYGLREIATGVGVLSQPSAAGWLWGRVAGDLLDLASLGAAMSKSGANRNRVAAATAAVLGVAALDVLCGSQLSTQAESQEPNQPETLIRRAVSIDRSPEDLYNFWHDFERLPTFMTHLESVAISGDKRSHWIAKSPLGKTVQWDAEIVDDQPGSRIAWRSLPGSDVDHAGSVSFEKAPGNRGTFVHVEMEYNPPGGPIVGKLFRLFGDAPGQQLENDLRRFKQIMELGEVVASDASIHPSPHAAQPPLTYFPPAPALAGQQS